MKRTSFATVVMGALAVSGCEPIGPTDVDAPQFKVARVIESVTGSGHFTDVRGDAQLRTFSFNAVKRADGTVTGEWQRLNRSLDAKAHGDVTCFTIAGNQAWLGGVVERTTTVPGGVFWTVVDNGEGANSPPDQISLQLVGRSQEDVDLFCDIQLPRPVVDIEAGNIKVRG